MQRSFDKNALSLFYFIFVSFSEIRTPLRSRKSERPVGQHYCKLAHFSLRETVLVVVIVGVRTDLVEAVLVDFEKKTHVVVHFEDL